MGGDFESAGDIYRQILDVEPNHPDTCQAYGILCCQTGDYPSGSVYLARAAQLMPDNPDVHSNLGNALRVLEQFVDGAMMCRRAIELNPKHPGAWSNLSACLRMTGEIQEAESAAAQALKLAPDFPEARINRACALQSLGRLDLAVEEFEKAVKAAPGNLYAWNCYLFALQYSDRHNAADLWTAAKKFGVHMGPNVARPKRETLRRVGFLSGDFCQHPVGLFLEPLLENWDHSRHEIYLYSNKPDDDEVTERLKKHIDGWRPIHAMGDEAAFDLIQKDEIDLLVDLSGHTAKNRVRLVSMKPAAVQASWLGYSATTGLNQVDWMIGDPWVTPVGQEKNYSERVYRLPNSFLSFSPPLFAPSSCRIAPHEGVRFASFNNPAKISDASVAIWSSVLNAVPDSVLVLKYRSFGDEEVREAFRAKFARHKIGPERLEFHGWLPPSEHFLLYETIDLALDTFPYTGATTTVEALWMGVPVVTMTGDRYVSGMAASVLSSAGCGDWVTGSRAEFLEKCVELVSDGEGLSTFRKTLRSQLLASPLMNHPQFASDFQNGLDEMFVST